MNIEFQNRPGSTVAKVQLETGETCVSEGGAMIAMNGHISVTTTTHKKNKGGIMKAVKRLIAGESFFMNHFTSEGAPGELFLSSSLPGDMMEYKLQEGETLVVQGGSFVASEDSVEVNLGWQGFKSILSGEGLFWIHLKGPGKVIINSFGAIYPREVSGEYIVDTGHIVAFNDSLEFDLTKAGSSWISSILGGEGIVCKFKGTGTVWCQSHNPNSFGGTLGPMLKPR